MERKENDSRITPGAERPETYLPLLKGKSVAVFANQTSMVKNTHLVDTLVKCGIKIVKIFGPEHGFRG
ncbi:MAG: exo-beta-N-acetylmuramidase NamZ domain-containing protein, partial [Ferruginibacter sp.]